MSTSAAAHAAATSAASDPAGSDITAEPAETASAIAGARQGSPADGDAGRDTPSRTRNTAGLRLDYPPELPVSARRQAIAEAIAANQVVIVSGETGSGKTTQIPKILLELGYGGDQDDGDKATGRHRPPAGETRPGRSRRGKGGRRRRMIAHTQPRRIAARTVAERLAAELATPLGQAVGYQVRFQDHSGPQTRLKVMTDGVLLAQIQSDPLLEAYDAIIIDEAHERSLNIDFLLGYISHLLPKRPDLKVVITSATIDSELFAAHFGQDPDHPAPVIHVTGRTFPVEIRYRPLGQGGAPDDQPSAIVAATRELMRAGDGDILVFCSGEREIADAADALAADLPGLDLLPLYSRLSAAEQHRVFEPHQGRRVVLATNVAETSLTVPGIHYVIDPGTARISRYSKATKVQRLPIEPISQASANQRAGRCGRIAAGVCVRLYSEEDFAGRPEFTDPEILRTSLAAVILQMIAVGVVSSPAEVARFGFVQPPEARGVADGVKLLEELGAIRQAGGKTVLTEVGRALARIPLDPRLGRMVIEAERLGVAPEVTVVAAALTIQDPRERPLEFRPQADQAHARFNDPSSDFLSFLNLWEHLRQARADKSSSAFRRLVRAEYLNYLRIREWQDLVKELRRALKDAARAGGRGAREERKNRGARDARSGRPGPPPPPKESHHPVPEYLRCIEDAPKGTGRGSGRHPAGNGASPHYGREEGGTGDGMADGADGLRRRWPADAIHRALLTGLLSQIGLRQATQVGQRGQPPTRGRADQRRLRGEYLGARNVKFAIHPGSALKSKPPDWVMAAELVETSRLWARTCAAIKPEWVEAAAPHLARRTHAEPRWSAKRGAAVITERVLVYGLPVVTGRVVPLNQIDPALARELFIRHALVEGEWACDHAFHKQNRELIERAEERAARSRSTRPPISDDALFDFYDQRLPASAVSARHFDSWWKRARQATPDLLTLSEAELDAGGLGADAAFPDEWVQGAFRLPLTYEYSPGSDQDGVTVHIPVHYANQIKPGGFDWQVPGLRQDLVAALIKALPKRLRAELLPARDTARQAVQALGDPADWLGPDGLPVPLASALTKVFQSLRGVFVPPEAWTWEGVPTHLRMDFVVEDANGRTMARGRDLPATVATVIADVSAAIDQVAAASGRARRKAASPPHGAPVRQTQPSGTARRAQPGSDSRPTSSEGGGEAARQTRPGPPGQTASSGGGAAKAPGLAAAPVWTGARDKLTTWDFDELPTEVTVAGSGGDGIGHRNGGSEDRSGSRSGGDGIGHRSGGGMPDVRGYPALVADGGCVALRLLTTEVEAAQANRAGVRELLLGELALPSRRLTSRLAREVALGLAASRYPSVEALTRDAQAAVVDQAVAEAGVPRDRAAYETLRDDLRHALEDRTHPVLLAASGLIAQGRAIETQAERVADLAVLNSAVDVKNHVADLLGDGFLTRAGLRRLPDLRRYLAGDTYRLERLGQARAREEQALWLLADLRRAFEAAAAAGGPALPDPLTEVPWMLEELRVSLLAQPLGTAYPVSEKRIRKVLAAAV